MTKKLILFLKVKKEIRVNNKFENNINNNT